MAHTSKGHRFGKKYAGTHTTVISAAEAICDTLNDSPVIKRIALGLIKSGHRGTGKASLKIIEQGGCILLVIKGNVSSQHIRIYTDNNARAKAFIAETAQEKGFLVSFREGSE